MEEADVKLYKAEGLNNERLDVIINDQLLVSYNIKENNLPIKVASDILQVDEIGMAVNINGEPIAIHYSFVSKNMFPKIMEDEPNIKSMFALKKSLFPSYIY